MCAAVCGTIVTAMTETLSDLPPSGPSAGPTPDPSRLVRDPDDRVVAGVCAAFARSTGTDPVLWRVVVAVLAVFGGAGLALYLIGWLLVPRLGEERSWLERTVRRPDRTTKVAGVVLVTVLAVALLASLDQGTGAGALAVVAVVAWLAWRERETVPPAAAPGYGEGYGEVPAPAYGPLPPTYLSASVPVAAPRRGRSVLGPVTLSVAALVAAVLLTLRALGLDGVTAPRVLAAALVVVGAGLVVGTWVGRARWLVVPGLVLALAMAGTAAADQHLGDGVGQRTWVARGDATYALGAGQAVLDLRQLGERRSTVHVALGAGQLVVLVPTSRAVAVTAHVHYGDVHTLQPGGERTTYGNSDQSDRREQFVVGTPSDVSADLDLSVGLGEIEVRRVAP